MFLRFCSLFANFRFESASLSSFLSYKKPCSFENPSRLLDYNSKILAKIIFRTDLQQVLHTLLTAKQINLQSYGFYGKTANHKIGTKKSTKILPSWTFCSIKICTLVLLLSANKHFYSFPKRCKITAFRKYMLSPTPPRHKLHHQEQECGE